MHKQLTILVALAIGLQSSLALAYEPIEDPNLLGWWTCDETSGKTVSDTSVNRCNGQVVGVPFWLQGVYGNALQLRNSAYVEIPSIDKTLSQATIALWIKPNGTQPDYATILSANSVSLNLASDWRLGYHWKTSYTYQTGLYLVANQWNFIAVTIAPDAASFYLNGELVSANVVPHSAVDWDETIYLSGNGIDSSVPKLTDAVLDDVSLFDRALKPRQILRLIQGLERPELAHAPIPDDEATDVLRDTILTWQAGESAVAHNVYLGTALDEVVESTPDNPGNVLVAHEQNVATYTPPVPLTYGQTYYWRVDEVTAAPSDNVFTGDVWSFTVESEFDLIDPINVEASFPYETNRGPEKTIDGSGLDTNEQHGTLLETMYIGDLIDGEPLVLQYDFDRLYKIEQIRIWNSNLVSEASLKFGLKNVTIEYKTNADQWMVLGDFEFEQGPGEANYTGEALNPPVAAAKSVRLIATTNYGGMKYSLSEIRFYTIPVQARNPVPISGAQDVPLNPVLSWRPSREAALHEIHLSEDANAIATGTALIDTTELSTYELNALDLGTTYFWRVDEINTAEPIPIWVGDLWSFTTEHYTVLEDFESYTDEPDYRIFETWTDGYGIDDNGSTVGNDQAPHSEAEIVHGGDWSMPFNYKNTQGAMIAETERTFTPSLNWTQGGIKTIALHFYGVPGNTGDLYLKINDEKIPYVGDETDLTRAQWQTWLVDLSTVPADVNAVTTLGIGVEGDGAIGKLYFDDIWLCGDISSTLPTPPDSNGLTLRYALDEGVGPDVRDTSGNGLNGTIHGSLQWTTGVYGRAMSFLGANDYIDTEVSLLNDFSEFSIACWVKASFSSVYPKGFVGQYGCVEFGTSDSYTVQLWTANGGTLEFDWPYRETTPSWHHLVAVGDGVSLKLYLDGLAVALGGKALGSTDPDYGQSESTTKIGGKLFAFDGSWFVGQLDEIYIYQRALSAAEAAALAGRTAPFYESDDLSY